MSIGAVLSEKERVREEAIKITRDIIRLSRTSINRLLSGDAEGAEKALNELSRLVDTLKGLVEPHPDIGYTGLVYNAVSEFVEANTVFHIVVSRRLPSPEELGVHYIPYLQGLCDSVGELKRYALRLIKENRFEEAEEILRIMEHIYTSIQPLAEYPDALVPGLRRKLDVLRRVIDDLEKFIVDLKSRSELVARLSECKSVLSGSRQ